MTFFPSIRTGFHKYADFTGPASRSEFWWWVLFTTLVSAAVDTAADAVFGDNSTLGALWFLAVLLPSLAVLVRRLRDAGFGWGHAFWLLLPFAGVIIIAAFCSQPSSRRHVAHLPATVVVAGAQS